MNEKVLHTLEYDKVIDLLADKADSKPGKTLCKSLKPMTDKAAIEQAQEETSCALTMLFQRGNTSFGSNVDLQEAMKYLEIGSTLSAAELMKVSAFLKNVARISSYAKKERDDQPDTVLDAYYSNLRSFPHISSDIDKCILSEEEIADDASANLKRIRRAIIQTGEKIHSQLNSMLNGSYRTYLQDAVITMRNNRYCIPVKSEYKSQVQGLVHDQSATGSTFFIEPAAVVNLNNSLRELGGKRGNSGDIGRTQCSGRRTHRGDS